MIQTVFLLQVLGELVDLQKVGPTADTCVFSGLKAGALYRLQVVSWSRGMSSDSSVLGRTGQSTLNFYLQVVFFPPFSSSMFNCAFDCDLYFTFFHRYYHYLSFSAVPSVVTSLKVRGSEQTDRLTVTWEHGAGSRSSYQVDFETKTNKSLVWD